jgi:GSH-dependent disulfide-bond oxidoreductase
MSADLELWFWPTPNGRKVTILLEELGLEYAVHPVSIRAGDQHAPDFLALNPNGKIPVLRDNRAGITLWESGAILLYLAEREGRFLPDGPGRWAAIQWLMWQMGGLGPMHGQANHFTAYVATTHDYARERYQAEARRLYGVADGQLARTEWLAGDAPSIADFAAWPWAAQMDRAGLTRAPFPHLARWFDAMAARPGVIRGMAVLADRTSPPVMTEAERDQMFPDRRAV